MMDKQAYRKIVRARREELPEEVRRAADATIATRVIESPEFTQTEALFTYLSIGSEVDTRAIIAAALGANAPKANEPKAGSFGADEPKADEAKAGRLDANDLATCNLGARTPQMGKLVALPRVVPGTRMMTWHVVASLADMERSPFGIEEPPATCEQIDPHAFAQAHKTLALVPGFVFDKKGNRIGYGGGFYDMFLAEFPGPTFGLCRASALVDDLAAKIPMEPHDLPVTRVITD